MQPLSTLEQQGELDWSLLLPQYSPSLVPLVEGAGHRQHAACSDGCELAAPHIVARVYSWVDMLTASCVMHLSHMPVDSASGNVSAGHTHCGWHAGTCTRQCLEYSNMQEIQLDVSCVLLHCTADVLCTGCTALHHCIQACLAWRCCICSAARTSLVR